MLQVYTDRTTGMSIIHTVVERSSLQLTSTQIYWSLIQPYVQLKFTTTICHLLSSSLLEIMDILVSLCRHVNEKNSRSYYAECTLVTVGICVCILPFDSDRQGKFLLIWFYFACFDFTSINQQLLWMWAFVMSDNWYLWVSNNTPNQV